MLCASVRLPFGGRTGCVAAADGCSAHAAGRRRHFSPLRRRLGLGASAQPCMLVYITSKKKKSCLFALFFFFFFFLNLGNR